ncbi:RNA 2',3'-cyclic phosphodiesterase [Chloroflexota bacterium]
MEQVRSFIAIELPDGLRQELGQLEAQLKSGEQSRVKWANPDSIHLTLKFLGNIGINRVGEIIGVMEEAVRGISTFCLGVKDPGVFPNVKRAQVAWVGLSGDVDRLLHLQQRLESGLESLGFAPESRAFTPHLTLARLHQRATPDEQQRFGQLVADSRFEAATTINVAAISLMKSQLTREGAIYSRLGLVGLKDLQAATA